MRQEDAETVALKALAWLASDEDMLRNFFSSTGMIPADLRHAAEDAVFLAGVLGFIVLDDAWMMAFADAAGVAPETAADALAALPGGATLHWT